jgi:hypothetical protein
VTTPPGPFSVDAGRGLGRLVVAVLDILRELIERQVLRRMDAGTLTADEIERLGAALIDLDRQFRELRTLFDDNGGTA